MKIYNFEQRSLEWYAARAGVITASEIDSIVTPTFKPRDSKGVQAYLNRKISERWMGGCAPTFQTEAMERGIEMEQSARDFYAHRFGVDLVQVGFITSDDGAIGCSPDALIGEDSGLEIKCPNADTHVGYLLDGVVPPKYAAQVQFSLYVTGRKSWVFMSYRPGFPPLIVTVEPDPCAFSAFGQILPDFVEQINAEFNFVAKLNGGLPDKNFFREEILANCELIGATETENDIIP